MGIRIIHKKHGEFFLDGITEIHYGYKQLEKNENRIAFESDINETGNSYDMDDIIEFEAIIK